MSVQNSTSKVQYTLTTAGQTLSVPFYFLANSELKVIKTSTTGVDTTLTLASDYTVSGAGNELGGSITMVGGAADEIITIKRNMTLTQLVDYIANDAFPAETHEQALDRLTMIAQQIKELSERGIRYPESEPVDSDPELPSKTARVSSYLKFDENGDLVVQANTDVANSAAAAATSASAAAASAAAAADSAADALAHAESINPANLATKAEVADLSGVTNPAAAFNIGRIGWEDVVRKMQDGDTVTLVCMGDSITLGRDGDDGGGATTLGTTYPARLQEYLRDYFENTNISVVNRGTSGRTVASAINNDISTVLTDAPDAVICFYGANDNWNNDTDPETYITNYKSLILGLQANGTIPVAIITAPPRYVRGTTTVREDESYAKRLWQRFHDGLHRLANGYDVKLVDANKYLLQQTRVRPDDPLHVVADYVHFDQAQNDRFAQFVYMSLFWPEQIIVSDPTFFHAKDPAISYKIGYENWALNPTNQAVGDFDKKDASSPVGDYAILDASNATDVLTQWVFVNSASARFAVVGMLMPDGTTDGTISIDGVSSAISSYHSTLAAGEALYHVELFATRIGYGPHKIVITPASDGTNDRLYIEGTSITPIKGTDFVDTISARPLVATTTNQAPLKKDSELVTGDPIVAQGGVVQFERLFKIDCTETEAVRIVGKFSNASGVGVGSSYGDNAGTIECHPSVFVWLSSPDAEVRYFHGFEQAIKETASFTDTDETLAYSTGSNQLRVIDYIKNGNYIDIYLDGQYVGTTFEKVPVVNFDLFAVTNSVTIYISSVLKINDGRKAGYWFLGDTLKRPIEATWEASRDICTTAGIYGSAIPVWSSSTAYSILKSRVKLGGNCYVLVTAGTSAGSGGPTGTGTGIVDGTCVWDYVGPIAVFS